MSIAHYTKIECVKLNILCNFTIIFYNHNLVQKAVCILIKSPQITGKRQEEKGRVPKLFEDSYFFPAFFIQLPDFNEVILFWR